MRSSCYLFVLQVTLSQALKVIEVAVYMHFPSSDYPKVSAHNFKKATTAYYKGTTT